MSLRVAPSGVEGADEAAATPGDPGPRNDKILITDPLMTLPQHPFLPLPWFAKHTTGPERREMTPVISNMTIHTFTLHFPDGTL